MPQPSLAPNNTAKGLVAGIIAALIWGAFPAFTRLGVGPGSQLDEFDVAALRFLVAGVIMLPYFLKNRFNGISWKHATFMVCGAGAPYMLIVAIGLSYAPAGHFGIITPSVMLAFSAIAGWLLLGDKPNPIRLFGLVTIVVGVACIGWKSLMASTGDVIVGDFFFLLGGILWGTYTVASKSAGANPFHSTAIVSVASMVLVIPTYFYARGLSHIIEAPIPAVIQGLYQGVFSAFLALFFYSRAVSLLGAAQGAVFAALVPAIAILLAIPLLGEIPSLTEMVGVAIVTLGMLFSLGIHKLFLKKGIRE